MQGSQRQEDPGFDRLPPPVTVGRRTAGPLKALIKAVMRSFETSAAEVA
jgi:hypothetical protein